MKSCLVLTVCALAVAAMVPRDTQLESESGNSTDPSSKVICAWYTACAFQTYDPETRRPTEYLESSYCHCGNGTRCQAFMDDTSNKYYTYRCLDENGQPTTSEQTNAS